MRNKIQRRNKFRKGSATRKAPGFGPIKEGLDKALQYLIIRFRNILKSSLIALLPKRPHQASWYKVPNVRRVPT